MKTYSSNVDLPDLLNEVRSIPLRRIPDGSGSSHSDGPEGWIYGLSMVRIALPQYPVVTRAVSSLLSQIRQRQIVQVMVNELVAGGNLSAHKDAPPDHLRFHLPVITHEGVVWWDELGGTVHMKQNVWHGPVNYCGILHAMRNNSQHTRIHIVVDIRKD